MTEYDACEQAYKHGYADGYSKAIVEAYERIALKFRLDPAYNKYGRAFPVWEDFRAAVDALPTN